MIHGRSYGASLLTCTRESLRKLPSGGLYTAVSGSILKVYASVRKLVYFHAFRNDDISNLHERAITSLKVAEIVDIELKDVRQQSFRAY